MVKTSIKSKKKAPESNQLEIREVSERFKNGMKVRRLVHGSDYVDKVWKDAHGNEQKSALQDFITESVWGMLWSRGKIPIKTRSLITLAFLIATLRKQDLKLHVRSAVLRNGCSIDEVREVMLHAAAYCGVVSATEAFEIADEIEQEISASKIQPFKKNASRKQP